MGLSSLSCFSLLRFSQSLALRLVVLCWRLELFHPWLHSRLSLESNSQSSWRQIMSLLIHRYRSIICSKLLGTICSQIASDGILAARRCSDITRDFIPTREFGNKSLASNLVDHKSTTVIFNLSRQATLIECESKSKDHTVWNLKKWVVGDTRLKETYDSLVDYPECRIGRVLLLLLLLLFLFWWKIVCSTIRCGLGLCHQDQVDQLSMQVITVLRYVTEWLWDLSASQWYFFAMIGCCDCFGFGFWLSAEKRAYSYLRSTEPSPLNESCKTFLYFDDK